MAISYRASLLFYIAALVIFTGAALTLFSFHSSSKAAELMAESLFQQVNAAAARQTSTHVLRAVPLAQSLGALCGRGLRIDDSDTLVQQLVDVMRVHPTMTWVSFSDEQGTFTGADWIAKGKLQASQSHLGKGGGLSFTYDVYSDGSFVLLRKEASNYDPRTRPFYLAAKRSGKTSWVGPYRFFEGIPGVTCAQPVYDDNGKFQGVITVDFDLKNLSDFARQAEQAISPRCRLVIMTPDGLVLGDPDAQVDPPTVGDQTPLPQVSAIGDPLAAVIFAAIPAKVRQETQEGATRPDVAPGTLQHFHTFTLEHLNQPYFAAVTTFRVDEGLTWVVAIAAPQADFLADARHDAIVAAGVSSGAVVAAVLIAVILSRRVSDPILALVGFMRRVGAGELEAKAELGGSSEFRELSRELNQMILDLRDRLRIRNSLAVAQQIQRKLLPAAPPEVRGLDVAGHSTYCDETGGDYYDFLIFDHIGPRLFVTIGDVMGHGVGSALPMAGARAVLRTRAAVEPSLGSLLSEVNRLMADDLGGQSFMTMLVAVIDLGAGIVQWASAGHDPMIVYDATSDKFFELKGASIPLGIDEATDYDSYSDDRLRQGQILVLASDGVWETADAERNMYGKDRLRDVMKANASKSSAEISAAIKLDVETFRGPAPQTDDVTFVVIKVVDPISKSK